MKIKYFSLCCMLLLCFLIFFTMLHYYFLNFVNQFKIRSKTLTLVFMILMIFEDMSIDFFNYSIENIF